MSIKIKTMSKEVTAWIKEITFEREGETHLVTLYWNINDGYDLVFKNSSLFKPSWVFTEYKLLGELEELLDEMTEEVSV